MSNQYDPEANLNSLDRAKLLDVLCDEFESACQRETSRALKPILRA